MKWLRFFAVICVGLVGGCGDAIQSPDFTSQMESITVSSASPSVALGETLQLTATGHYSQPPGSESATAARDITHSVTWTSDAPDIAAVDVNGVVTALQVGSAQIVAHDGDIVSDPYTVDVGAAVLRGLQVRNIANQTLTQIALADGQSLQLFAWGQYSDGSLQLLQASEHVAHWASNNPGVAAPDAPTGTQVTLAATAAGSAALAVSLTHADSGNPVYAHDGTTQIAVTLPVTVSAAQVTGLSHIRWSDDETPLETMPTTGLTIALGATRKAVAVGTFTDGSAGIVADNLLDWSTLPAGSSLASVDASGAVSGLQKGVLDLVTGLKTPPAGGGTASVSRALSVNDPSCMNPARDDRYYANGWFVPVLCLICSANGAANVINPDDSDYATLTNNVALLGGETAINVGLKPNSDGTVDTLNTGPAPTPVRFLIAIDPGTFPVLTLGLFNQLYVSLHLDTDTSAPPLSDLNGILGFDSLTNRVAASGAGDGGTNALELTLLGLQLVPGLETVEASFVPPANLEYNRLRLGNSAGVAEVSLSKSVRVSNACVGD